MILPGSVFPLDPDRDQLALGVSGDLWSFDVLQHRWSLVPMSIGAPTQRWSHVAAWDGTFLWLHGGWSYLAPSGWLVRVMTRVTVYCGGGC